MATNNDSLDALEKTLEKTNRSVSELTRALSGLSRPLAAPRPAAPRPKKDAPPETSRTLAEVVGQLLWGGRVPPQPKPALKPVWRVGQDPAGPIGEVVASMGRKIGGGVAHALSAVPKKVLLGGALGAGAGAISGIPGSGNLSAKIGRTIFDTAIGVGKALPAVFMSGLRGLGSLLHMSTIAERARLGGVVGAGAGAFYDWRSGRGHKPSDDKRPDRTPRPSSTSAELRSLDLLAEIAKSLSVLVQKTPAVSPPGRGGLAAAPLPPLSPSRGHTWGQFNILQSVGETLAKTLSNIVKGIVLGVEDLRGPSRGGLSKFIRSGGAPYAPLKSGRPASSFPKYEYGQTPNQKLTFLQSVGEYFRKLAGVKPYTPRFPYEAPPPPAPQTPDMQIISLLKEISGTLAKMATHAGVPGMPKLPKSAQKQREEQIASLLEDVSEAKKPGLQLEGWSDYLQTQLGFEKPRMHRAPPVRVGPTGAKWTEPGAPPPEPMSSPDLLGPLRPVPPTAGAVSLAAPRGAELRRELEEARMEIAGGEPLWTPAGSLMGAPPTAAAHALAALGKSALVVPPTVSQPILGAEARSAPGEGVSGGIFANPAAAVAPVLRRLRAAQHRRLSRLGPEALAAEGRRHEEALRQQGVWEGSLPTPTFPPAEAFPAPRGPDTIPAMLQEGEAVLTPEQAAELGLGGIQTVAGGGIQYLASGTGTGSSKNLAFLTDLAANLTKVGLAVKLTQEALGGFAETVLHSQKKFEASGAMAQVFARQEIFEFMRNIKIGNALAPSAGRLESSWENLETTLTPYVIGSLEMLNEFAETAVELVQMLVKVTEVGVGSLSQGLDALLGTGGAIQELFQEFLRRGEEYNDSQPAGDFLRDNVEDFDWRRRLRGHEHAQGGRPTTAGRMPRNFMRPGERLF